MTTANWVQGNLPSRTAIQDEIAEVENRLELTISVDPGLVERFERSSREVGVVIQLSEN